MKNKVPTIKEIANIANVSLMTVSRALNNNPRVREQTRKKILNIAKELNYRPNRIARSLVSKKSNLISLIVADIRNQFFAELARGIEDKAWESGYNVIISSTDNDPKRLESQVRLMMEMGVDGFILASVRLKEPIVDTLIQQDIPVVLEVYANTPYPKGIWSVVWAEEFNSWLKETLQEFLQDDGDIVETIEAINDQITDLNAKYNL